jgi:outer membrane lipoprotein-sorting protein
MRRSVPVAALAAFLVISSAAAVFAQPAVSGALPTVDTLVAKNLQAKGGEAKLKAIQTMRMSGRVSIQGMELPMTIAAKRPNLMRQEMQIQDKRIVTAFDGQKAWMINPMMGTESAQELTGPQADMAKDQADFDGALVDWKAKGHTVELVGLEEVGGVKAQKIKVTKKNGQVQYFFLNPDTGLEIKTTTEVQQGGTTMTVETELSDYRSVDGIMLPHALKTSINGTPTASIVVEKIELNAPLDESTFTLPKPKA